MKEKVEGRRRQNRSLVRGALCQVRREGRKVVGGVEGTRRQRRHGVQTQQVGPTQTTGWDEGGGALGQTRRFSSKKRLPSCKAVVSWQLTAIVSAGSTQLSDQV